jgi:hypothetical protein
METAMIFLCDILLVLFSLASAIWAAAGIMLFISIRRDEKRKDEYHRKRMKNIL